MTNTILYLHYGLALVLFLTAVVAVFVPRVRKVIDYLLVLQIGLGIGTWVTGKVAPPALHWILAILVGGVWPVARALDRRGRPRAATMGLAALGVVVLAFIMYLGMHAFRAHTPSA